MYRTHLAAVHAYCARRLPPREVDDATADVFVVAWRRLDDLPDETGVLPWLYTVGRNVVSNRRRAERRRGGLSRKLKSLGAGNSPGADLEVVRLAEYDDLLHAISMLPEPDQEILRLVEWEGLDRSTVAAIFDITPNAINQRMARAYRKLGRRLDHSTTVLATTPRPLEEGGEA